MLETRGSVLSFSAMRDEVSSGIVADGRDRLLAACSGEIRQIEAEIRARHAQELAQAGFLDRLRIEAKVRQEIQREIDRIAPPEACY